MKLLPSILGALALAAATLPASAQQTSRQPREEFYRRVWYDAAERIHFCSPIDSLGGEYEVFGVQRDQMGRPVTVTRYFYRNIDTRADWAIMRLGYSMAGNLTVTRTFHAPNGTPVPLGTVMAEEAVYRNDGRDLLIRRTLDSAGRLTNDTGGVSQSIYRGMGSAIQQEFFYGAGKQHFGADLPWRPFAPLPKGAYFRLYTADTAGNLLREELRGFDKKPVPFPGGEYVRRYTPGSCGLPERVEYLDLDGRPMADAEGLGSERFVYDERGHVVAWEGFDAAGDPKGRASDGAARVERSYRAIDGLLLTERKLDVSGREIAAK